MEKDDYTTAVEMPRPPYDEDAILDSKTKKKRLSMGSKTAGVIFDVTKKGIYFNGYYRGIRENNFHACIREPGFISWEDLDKIKESFDKVKKPRKKGEKREKEPDIKDTPSDEYLATLPRVTLNGAQYYIDADRRERRLVARPYNVFKF